MNRFSKQDKDIYFDYLDDSFLRPEIEHYLMARARQINIQLVFRWYPIINELLEFYNENIV